MYQRQQFDIKTDDAGFFNRAGRAADYILAGAVLPGVSPTNISDDLKQEYNFQSSINVGKYELDLNERVLKVDQNKLSLTEMEANVILFLINSNDPVNIKKLQEKVWGHMPDLETHTVETHIYRLRKKIKDKFQDSNFIISLKNGYKIV